MAYNTKPIITDKDGNPTSQYYNKELDQYEPVEGSKGANKVIVYKSDGTESDISLLPILDKLNQLTGTVIDEETRKSNELQRIALYNQISQMLQDGELKGDKGDTGNGLEFTWQGTSLGVRVEGQTEYIFVDLQGPEGPRGLPGTIENLDKMHIEEALGYTPVKSVNGKAGEEVVITQEDIGLNEEGFISTEPTVNSIIQMPLGIKEAPIKLNLKGRTISNAVVNGNFKDGTNGWAGALGGVPTASSNILSISSNGTYSSPYTYRGTNIPAIAGKKIFVRCKFKVTNAVCKHVRLGIQAKDATSGATDSVDATSVFSPSENISYLLSNILTVPNNKIETIRVYIQHIYEDETIANGKVMEVQEVMAIDIDQHPELQGLTVEEINKRIPYYVDGTQSVEGLKIKSIGKNYIKGEKEQDNSLFNRGVGTSKYDNVWKDGKLRVSNGSSNVQGRGVGVKVKVGQPYTFKCSVQESDVVTLIAFKYANGVTFRNFYPHIKESTTFTPTEDVIYLSFLRSGVNDDTQPVYFWNIQLEEGEIATEYEPYTETSTFFAEGLYQLPNGVRDELNGDLLIRRVGKKYKITKDTQAFLMTAHQYVNILSIDKNQFNNTSSLGDSTGRRMLVKGFAPRLGVPYASVEAIGTCYENVDPFFLVLDKNKYKTLSETLEILENNHGTIQYQLATPEVKQLSLSPIIAKKDGHIMVEGWRRYVLKSEDINEVTPRGELDLAGVRSVILDIVRPNSPLSTLNYDVCNIPGKKQTLSSTNMPKENLGHYYVAPIGDSSTGADIWFAVPVGTTIKEARKLLEGTIIHYKVAPEYSINPSWSIEVPTTLKTQINENSNEIAKVSSLVQEHEDLLQTHGIRLDNVQGIVESGSNANGEYVKFADGTMICKAKILINNTVPLGDSYNATANYPASYIEAPIISGVLSSRYVNGSGHTTSSGTLHMSGAYTSHYQFRFFPNYTFDSTMTQEVHCIMMGRWK